MKIIYATDLHGDKTRCLRVFEAASRHGAAAVVNGGDMLPSEGDLHGSQREFAEGFLAGYFTGHEKAGIAWLGMLGNDDLKIHDAVFDSICRKYENIFNLAQRRIKFNGFEFIGMNWVTDYPFRLKDRCRRDGPGYVFQEQFGTGLISTPKGFKELDNWSAYAGTLPTIKDELAALPEPENTARAVYVIHMPPAGLGLDVIGSGDKVGSQAVSEFIRKRRPLLTFHGHVHESPEISGVWQAKIGKTVCVQPGQAKAALTYVSIDLDTMAMERFVEPV